MAEALHQGHLAIIKTLHRGADRARDAPASLDAAFMKRSGMGRKGEGSWNCLFVS